MPALLAALRGVRGAPHSRVDRANGSTHSVPVLNLYLAPRSGRVLPALALQNAEEFLYGHGIIGELGADGDYIPGPRIARLYNKDAHEDLLPAELTCDAVRIVNRPRPFFLPMNQPVEGYDAPLCNVCEDMIDLDALDASLAEIAFRPVKRFAYQCPSCRTELRIDQIDFGQEVAVAAQWIFIEGAGTSRLNPKLVEALGRAMGTQLVIVPEVPEDDLDDWAMTQRRRW